MSIQDKIIKHQIFLERFAGGVAQIIQKGLDEARDQIILQSLNNLNTLNTKELQASITSLIRRYTNQSLEQLKELALYEGQFNTKLLKSELEEVVEATQEALIAAFLLKAMPVGLNDGGTNRKVEPALNKFAEKAARQLVQPVKDAQVQGGDMVEVAAVIAALAAGLVSAQARSVARSASVHASNTSKDVVYKNNPIEQVRWVSVLDSRTTPYCRRQDGKIYDVGEGPRPPAHYNCRSVVVPVVVQK